MQLTRMFVQGPVTMAALAVIYAHNAHVLGDPSRAQAGLLSLLECQDPHLYNHKQQSFIPLAA